MRPRTSEPAQAPRAVAACAHCGRPRTVAERVGGSLLAAISDGWWARSWHEPGACICGRCYRALHPLEREGWRRPSALLGLVPLAEALIALA